MLKEWCVYKNIDLALKLCFCNFDLMDPHFLHPTDEERRIIIVAVSRCIYSDENC